MNLFQRLLVAPAALGLIAPVAATAAELNLNDVSSYSSRAKRSAKRVQSYSQFSDVYPSDWTYQTLSSMLERHGCAPINGASMTRFEAAALLNKCLDNVAQVNKEERRLINEFSSELAVIKGSLEGVEAGIGFEENQFSTTTKLSGESIFVMGAVGSADSTKEAATFVYHHVLELETSFSGDDLMLTAIEAGNFGASDPFGGEGDVALESNYSSGSALNVAKLFYQFPWKEDFTITVGPIVRQDDILGVWPSDYPSDTVLDVLTYAGASAAYGLAEGAGAGITYAKDKFSATALFVSEEANSASEGSTDGSGNGGGGGLLTEQGSDDVTLQVAWVDDQYTLAAAYTKADNGNLLEAVDADDYTATGLSAVYRPEVDSRLVPSSISAGYGWKSVDNSNNSTVMDETTYTFGFLWDDVGTEGNTLGIGYGTAEGHRDQNGYDDPMAMEIFYSMAVSDNITVTPAFFSVEKNGAKDYTGGLVKTTFSF